MGLNVGMRDGGLVFDGLTDGVLVVGLAVVEGVEVVGCAMGTASPVPATVYI